VAFLGSGANSTAGATKSQIYTCLRMLNPRTRRKLIQITCAQIFLGLLDLVGVAIFGLLGTLTITGLQSQNPGTRVSQVLQFLNMTQFSLQLQILLLGASATTLLVLKTFASMIFTRKTIRFMSHQGAEISSGLFSRILSSPILRVDSVPRQQLIYSVAAGVETITLGILTSLVLFAADLSLLILLVAGLFAVDVVMALSSLTLFSFIAFFLYRILHGKALRLGQERATLSIKSESKIVESLDVFRETFLSNRFPYYIGEFSKLRIKLAAVDAERSFQPYIGKYVIEASLIIGTLLISALQFGFHTASHASAVISVFIIASARISPAVLRLQQNAVSIKSSLGAAEPTINLYKELSSVAEFSTLKGDIHTKHQGFIGNLEISDVSFTYPGAKAPAINNITLHAEFGDFVALVGSSGAGKTTLVDIMLGIITPTSGSVLLSGKSIQDCVRDFPGAIGYVPQDVHLFAGSVYSNITLGFGDTVDRELVMDALKIAQLDEWVSSLPQGVDTEVGERGTQLSGGQIQRIGIARAMLTKPKILILDEATSSLDGTTEWKITSAIQELRKATTVIMIAHRLSTLRECDRIYFLENGSIIGDGSFEELRKAVPSFDTQAKQMGL
jgi:ABC-type multidrug transport system fused ATPase/permease subunit